MRCKGPGHMARMYSSGVRKFSLRGGINTNYVAEMDFAEIEKRVLAKIEQRWSFPIVDAAAQYLATVSQDPRNHFGKHALRRFDK